MDPTHPGRSLVDTVWWAALPGAVLFTILQTADHVSRGVVGFDVHAYWLAAQSPETWYTLSPRLKDAYLYSPAFAELLRPLGYLDWHVFQVLWAAVSAAIVFWLLSPLGWRRGLTLASICVPELLVGNVYLFFAATLVIGLTRVPGSFAVFAITKVTPSVLFLWFLVRHESGRLAWAVGTTALIVGASFLLGPGEWVRWVKFLGASSGDGAVSALIRMVLAAGLTVYAAKTDRRWLLAPAVLLACPVVGGLSPLALLAAIPRLRQVRRERDWAREATEPAGAQRITASE